MNYPAVPGRPPAIHEVLEVQKQSILVVDITASGKRLAQCAASCGFDVWLAEDFDSAVTIIEGKGPAAVATELWLKDGCGLDLVKYARERQLGARVVIMTAFPSVSGALSALELGAADYLAKPVSPRRALVALGLPVEPAISDEPECHLRLQEASSLYIEDVLSMTASLSEAARVLGVDRKSLRRLLARRGGGSADVFGPGVEQAQLVKA
jgi:two-component system, response regulator RegA